MNNYRISYLRQVFITTTLQDFNAYREEADE